MSQHKGMKVLTADLTAILPISQKAGLSPIWAMESLSTKGFAETVYDLGVKLKAIEAMKEKLS